MARQAAFCQALAGGLLHSSVHQRNSAGDPSPHVICGSPGARRSGQNAGYWDYRLIDTKPSTAYSTLARERLRDIPPECNRDSICRRSAHVFTLTSREGWPVSIFQEVIVL